ncbi:hypothetical protein ABT297_22480 [Dactylosporangium sp. NPDC000555]|uniref:hypothetical protein n=1 Tax=Dactylosporangium sp. NPDC000555 TaxID=3154260 RepID=UPI00332FDCB9
MSTPIDSLLRALIGEDLAEVIFVRDYVQLGFDGPRLSLFVWPRVTLGSTVREIGESGYRDALCDLIGHFVVDVEESSASGLVLNFDIGSVTVKPTPPELIGPEIAMLSGFVDRPDWMVWRPGEEPFDGPEWS